MVLLILKGSSLSNAITKRFKFQYGSTDTNNDGKSECVKANLNSNMVLLIRKRCYL